MTQRNSKPSVGIVVPTLGTRSQFLEACVNSIRKAGNAHICLVGPASLELQPIREQCDSFVIDSGRGLASAINSGIASLPESVTLVNWLGDDDLIQEDALQRLQSALTKNPRAVLAYGHCQYINSEGEALFTVRAGRWAEILMRCGPQLISQPAMLFRRDIFRLVGGLDEKLGWAFDLDLLLKFRRLGRFIAMPHVVASYRWHDGALTVGNRKESVSEASVVRVRNLHPVFRTLSPIWEPFLRGAILRTGEVLRRRYSNAQEKK